MMEKDQEFLEFILKSIVDHPDEIKVERTVDEMGVLLTAHCHQEDMGLIIGRKGSTAHAIRTLLRTFGAKNKSRVNFKIYEEDRPDRPRGPRHDYNDRGRDDRDSGMGMNQDATDISDLNL